MTLKLSLVISGEASGAKAAATETRIAMAGIGAESDRASAAMAAAVGKVKAASDSATISLGRVREELGRNANQAPAAFNSSVINKSLNVSSDFGAAARGVDVKAYGAELDSLRAKFSPLFALQQQYRGQLAEISTAARVGAINEKERAAAVQTAKDAFAQQVTGLNKTVAGNNAVAASSGLARHEMINLSRQAQDVGVSLASGQSPFLVLIQQGTQIADVFASSTGTIGGFFKQAAAGILGFLTPVALVTGALLAIGASTAIAASQYGDSQRQIQVALTGTGLAAGVLSSDINKIAASSASTFGLSVSEARAFATELVATGKIGRDALQPIVAVGHDVATAYGEDAASAARRLAAAMADPVKGATDLNARLGFLDAGMLRQITNLQAQNRLLEAQQLLTGGIKSGVEGVNQSVATSTKFWTAIGNTISGMWDAFGRGASRFTGIGFTEGLDEKITAAQGKIANLQKQIESISTGPAVLRNPTILAGLGKQLQEAQVDYQKLQVSSDAYWRSVSEAQDRQRSFAPAAAIGAILPDIRELDQARNQLSLLAGVMVDVQTSANPETEAIRRTGQSLTDFSRALAEAAGRYDAFRTSHEKTVESLNQQIGAVGKRSPLQLGQQAYDQTLLSRGSTSPDAVGEADLARTLAVRQAQQQITDSARAQLLSTQQRVDTAGLELSLVGRGVVEQERQRAILQAKQQLEQDALRIYGDRDAYDQKHLSKLTEQLNKEASIKQMLAEQQLSRDVSFERSQIGRTTDEQAIAGRLRGIYGDEYQSQMNGAIAGQIRLNQQLQFTSDLGSTAFKGFLSDLRQGKSLGEAMGNALVGGLNKMAGRMADSAWSALWQNVMGSNAGGGVGGILGSLLGIGGGGGGGGGTGLSLTTTGGLYEDGGYTGSIGKTKIAGFVHGNEFVMDAEHTAKHRPLLEAIYNDRIPGYMDGGYVGPPSIAAWNGTSSSGRTSRQIQVTVENHAPGVEYDARQITEEEVRLIARHESSRQISDRVPSLVASQFASRNSEISKSLSSNSQINWKKS